MAGLNGKIKKKWILWTLVNVSWQDLMAKLKKIILWTLVNVLWQELIENLKEKNFVDII